MKKCSLELISSAYQSLSLSFCLVTHTGIWIGIISNNLKCSSGTEKLNTLLKESKRSEDIRDIPQIFFLMHTWKIPVIIIVFILMSCITVKVLLADRWETSKSFILMKRERCLNSAQLENRIYVTIMIFLTHSGRKSPYINSIHPY